MLIEDVEKLIKQLQEEQGMTRNGARQEVLKRTLENMDNDFEVERSFDRPLGGISTPPFEKLEGDPELEEDSPFEDDGNLSESKGFFRRIIDKFAKGEKSDDFDF